MARATAMTVSGSTWCSRHSWRASSTASRTSASAQSSALHHAGRRAVTPGAGVTPAEMRREVRDVVASTGARRNRRASACRDRMTVALSRTSSYDERAAQSPQAWQRGSMCSPESVFAPPLRHSAVEGGFPRGAAFLALSGLQIKGLLVAVCLGVFVDLAVVLAKDLGDHIAIGQAATLGLGLDCLGDFGRNAGPQDRAITLRRASELGHGLILAPIC